MINAITLYKNRKDFLGINDRNYTFSYLNRGKRRIADDKLITKKLLKKNDISAPELFGVVQSRKELDRFDFEALPASFVLKPSRGVKGAGINIYYNKGKEGKWIKADRTKDSVEDIKAHIVNILDGQFTMGITPEPSAAIFEERIQMHPSFKFYSYRGIPDIRVIVYNGIPVMAMLRLPTEESEGKANISRGALGVGIDMARGVTTTAVKNGRSIENVPKTNLRLSGIKIPYWTKILRLSHRCQKFSGLGYLGVDIIIDRDKGPLVVELNSRPGLGIQVANEAGLKERMARVKKIKDVSEERAIRLAKDLFGGEIEEEIYNISGREVISLIEEVMLYDKEGRGIKIKAKVDTGAESSSIDRKLAFTLGYKSVIEEFDNLLKTHTSKDLEKLFKEGNLKTSDEILDLQKIKSSLGYEYRMYTTFNAQIGEKRFEMKANIADRSQLAFPLLIGKRDLKDFLIDTTK